MADVTWTLDRDGYPVSLGGVKLSLLSGSELDLVAPSPSHLTPSVIAIGLSRLHRYAGQSPIPWTVGQHTLAMDEVLPIPLRRLALTHDAHEAIIGDTPSPVKRAMVALGATDYDTLEDRVIASIDCRFGAPSASNKNTIKILDWCMIKYEREAIHMSATPTRQHTDWMRELAAELERTVPSLETRIRGAVRRWLDASPTTVHQELSHRLRQYDTMPHAR